MSRLSAGAMRHAEHPVIRKALARHEGENSARLFDHWADRQPTSATVIRGVDGDAVGALVILALQDVQPADPAVDAALPSLDRAAPLAAPTAGGSVAEEGSAGRLP
jgi:hypothetical protein